tara:strand:+ start:55 stop:753 length:699 start_codon:yes stop_codon:yes gene_type:complete
MKAIILAAGLGSRIKNDVNNTPKPLLRVGKQTIIERLVDQLKKNVSDNIIVVTGYKKEVIKDHLQNYSGIKFMDYDKFSKTNNLHTLWSVKEELDRDVIITFADLLVEDGIISSLTKSHADISLAVDNSNVLEDTMRVQTNSNKLISITATTKESATGNFLGIAKFSQEGCNILLNNMSELLGNQYKDDYYTIAINKYVELGGFVEIIDMQKYKWIEIDNIKNYEDAKKLFG